MTSRTPLNAILGNTELLLDGSAGPLSSEARACLGDIQLAGQRLMRQVERAARAAPRAQRAARRRGAGRSAGAAAAGAGRRAADAPEVTIAGLPGRRRAASSGAIPAGSRCWRHALVELYLDGARPRPAADRGRAGRAAAARLLRLSWVDFRPQQLAALPLALIDAILALT